MALFKCPIPFHAALLISVLEGRELEGSATDFLKVFFCISCFITAVKGQV